MTNETRARQTYLLLTERVAHTFTSRSAALEVFERAKRMGVEVEFIIPKALARRPRDPEHAAKQQRAWCGASVACEVLS